MPTEGISVVIPTGGEGHVRRAGVCIRSVLQQVPEPLEIVVVCLDKEGEEPADVSHLEAHARVVRRSYSGHYPPAYPRNVGIKESRGSMIAIVDSDAVLHPDTFEVASELMRRRRGFVRVSAWMMPQKFSSYSIHNPRRFEEVRDEGKRAWGPGGVLLVPREEVFDIRGWDEAYIGYGIADWDFVKRLEKAGLHHHELPSDEHGVYTMHQWHPRDREIDEMDCRKRNRVIYDVMLENANPMRNAGGWGGM